MTTSRSRSLVFVTQVIDPNSPLLGFTVDLVRGLAGRFERVVVIGNEVRSVSADLPGNVRVWSLGKESGAGRAERAMRYQRFLWRARSVDALFAHMCPDYLVAAGPIAVGTGMRRILWFAHPHDSNRLRAAEAVADAVLTSLPGSYPHPGPKVRAVGQAIDVERFTIARPLDREEGFRLVGLGRTSDAKRYDVAIVGVAAARAAGADVRLRIVGPSSTDAERHVRGALFDQVRRCGLGDVVSIEEGLAPAQVGDLLACSHALVNTTIAGSGDKVVLEAMAAGRPPLASNPAFSSLVAGFPVTLSFPEGDAPALGARIAALAEADLGDPLPSEMRDRIVRGHSLGHWADEVHDTVEPLVGGRR